jgi:hypothetical protein
MFGHKHRFFKPHHLLWWLGVSVTQRTRHGMHLGTQRASVGHARNCFFCCLCRLVVFVTTVEEGVICLACVCYRARAVCGVPLASPCFDVSASTTGTLRCTTAGVQPARVWSSMRVGRASTRKRTGGRESHG